tara:strand:- start:728 stop:1900 length:1173 start_codon:yes stop_codon:yes gene_type:complete
MKIGIDRISLYSSHYYVDLKNLAIERNVDPEKFYLGIGQEKMAVPAPDEDVVTLGANSAYPLKKSGELSDVDLLLFSTESGIDQSKSAGIYVHQLLELSPRCRTVELKQACYSGTAALQLAVQYVAGNPDKKVLVIAADIARYDLGSPSEPTQGCGAVSLLISANPRILEIEKESGYHTEDVMDFWRPNYRSEALVDGKYSVQVYMRILEECWKQYSQLSGNKYDDIDYFCYHIPFTKMAQKAHSKLCRSMNVELSDEMQAKDLNSSLCYSRLMGNSYTASIYIGLTSLLDSSEGDLSGSRVGLFSYGSGCVGEFFSGIIQPDYSKFLYTTEHQYMLEKRSALNYQQYEDMFNHEVPTDGGDYIFPQYKTGPFRLGGIKKHKRVYESIVS